ncbi:hypothetical protein [Faecalibaculum rodentium]|uniref:hypothetical protein n=1 Tax=Faecalibaculum rodentium TaxID=1702221 RepID=UPI0023EF866E|nr:hypothetical protein [Faecalibaculum rodentium]
MPVKKSFTEIQLKSGKLKAGVILLIILAVGFLIRLTPLVRVLWVNYLTWIIVRNAVSLIVIAGLLIALHIVDLKRFKETLDKEDEKNVH